MPTTTVQVQYASNGKPAVGFRVSLSFTGGLGGVTGTVLTDGRGAARIDHASVGQAKLIVQGETRRTEHCPGEYAVTI